MSVTAGVRLGPYEIVESLGAGGMGEVWRAKDTRLDREIAIKVLPAGFAKNDQFLQRFDREAKAISSLNHPHICTLHDVGHENDTHFLVMELIDGETLADRLKKGPLPLHEVLKLGRQIASALDAAHKRGVVHRDLKPGNIMLTRAGIKLLDFGLAKTASEGGGAIEGLTNLATEARPLTREGTILGTFQYMAPEQLESIEADARTDIFALGAVLYEMATGRRAFQGESKTSLIAAIVSQHPEPISTVTPMTPPALDHVVRKCLEKDPDDRWQSAHDVASELQWISEAGSQAGVATAVTVRRRTRERLAWTVAAILATALILVSVAYFRLSSVEVPMSKTHLLAPEGTRFDFSNIFTGSLAISPDGLHVAFTAVDQEGTRRLWIRPIDSLDARTIAGSEDAHHPFWSPDGTFVAFFADSKLKKADITGAPPLILCDAPNGRSGSWNEDGIIIFSPDTTMAIHKVPAAGGMAEPVTKLESATGETTHRWATFLPDGNHFLFMGGSHTLGTKSEANAIYAGSLDSTDRKLILRGRSNVAYSSGYLLYVQDSILVAQKFDPDALELEGNPIAIADSISYHPGWFRGVFSVSTNGVLVMQTGMVGDDARLIWADREGTEISAFSRQAPYQDLRLSPDEKRIAAVIANPDSGTTDIWIYEIERDVMTRFTFGEGNEADPVWSPDGSRIAFSASSIGNSGLRRDIYVKPLSGGREEALLSSDSNKVPTSWSPDGRLLAFIDTKDQNIDVWILPLEAGGEAYPLIATEFDESFPLFSPDGRWLAFLSDESGRSELYVVPFPSLNGKWQISTSGSNGQVWTKDELIWVAGNGTVMTTPWSASGNELRPGLSSSLFRRLDVVNGDITDDGQRVLLAINPESDDAPPVTVVTNWSRSLPD